MIYKIYNIIIFYNNCYCYACILLCQNEKVTNSSYGPIKPIHIVSVKLKQLKLKRERERERDQRVHVAPSSAMFMKYTK